jgi:DNA gyrase subunit A
VVQEADDVTIITASGLILRTTVQEIKRSGRATRGILLMDLQERDKVASLARISAADLRRVGVTQE